MSADLRIDWCSYQAAKWAVEHWHYSRTMPAGKTAKMGVWEDGGFIGAVIYSWGANNNIGKPYGLKQTEVCELVRVALTAHVSPVSQVVAETTKILRGQSPGLRLIVSYADPRQGHNGAIYQAMNWVYVPQGGETGGAEILVNGRWIHTRSLGARYGTRSMPVLRRMYPGANERKQGLKHKYLYPLDRAMRKQIEPLRKPYPKRQTCGPSVEGDTPPQAEGVVQSNGAAFTMQIERIA